jgi:alpha-L-fucosidase
VTNNGNYAINLGPRPDGTFHPDQVAVMDKVGAWLKENGEAIYETRGGPYRPSSWGASTHKGKKAYLHVMNWTDDKLRLPLLDQEVLTAKAKGQMLAMQKTGSAVEISVPENLWTDPVTIVALEFDRAVSPPTD